MKIRETGEGVYLVMIDDDESRRRIAETFKTADDAREYIRSDIEKRRDFYQMDEFVMSDDIEELISDWTDYADERFWIEKLYVKEKVPTTMEVMNESTK